MLREIQIKKSAINCEHLVQTLVVCRQSYVSSLNLKIRTLLTYSYERTTRFCQTIPSTNIHYDTWMKRCLKLRPPHPMGPFLFFTNKLYV